MRSRYTAAIPSPARRGRRPPASWIEAARRPALAGALEHQALVQAERPVAPELDGARPDPIARPVRRPRHLAQAEARADLGDALLEREAVGEGPRLLRRPRADLRRARARGEI